jgi:hypothetical protein
LCRTIGTKLLGRVPLFGRFFLYSHSARPLIVIPTEVEESLTTSQEGLKSLPCHVTNDFESRTWQHEHR